MKYRVKIVPEESKEIVVDAPNEEDARIKAEERVRGMDINRFGIDLEISEIDELESRIDDFVEAEKEKIEKMEDQVGCSYCNSEEARHCEKRSNPIITAFVCEECCLSCDRREDCEEPVWR